MVPRDLKIRKLNSNQILHILRDIVRYIQHHELTLPVSVVLDLFIIFQAVKDPIFLRGSYEVSLDIGSVCAVFTYGWITREL